MDVECIAAQVFLLQSGRMLPRLGHRSVCSCSGRFFACCRVKEKRAQVASGREAGVWMPLPISREESCSFIVRTIRKDTIQSQK